MRACHYGSRTTGDCDLLCGIDGRCDDSWLVDSNDYRRVGVIPYVDCSVSITHALAKEELVPAAATVTANVPMAVSFVRCIFVSRVVRLLRIGCSN